MHRVDSGVGSSPSHGDRRLRRMLRVEPGALYPGEAPLGIAHATSRRVFPPPAPCILGCLRFPKVPTSGTEPGMESARSPCGGCRARTVVTSVPSVHITVPSEPWGRGPGGLLRAWST